MKILLILFFLCPLVSAGQQDTIQTSEGQTFYKGQLITIGSGSKADHGYAHIYTKPEKSGRTVLSPVQLTSGWEGYKMKIIGFEYIGTEISGQRHYLILTIDNKKKSIKYICDPELALKANEIKL